MRRLAAILLAATVVAGAAWAADPRDPKKAYRKADQALARSVLVKRSDLPGWRVQPRDRLGDANLRCPGYSPDLSRVTLTGEAQSPYFAQGLVSFVFSTAHVYASAAQAATAWRLTTTPGLLRCMRMALERDVSRGSGVEVTTVSSGPLPFPRVADRSAAFRLVLEMKAQGVTVRAYFDIVGFDRGRVSTGLGFISFNRSFPASFEQALARSVAARMRGA